jgi:hypothetical protein
MHNYYYYYYYYYKYSWLYCTPCPVVIECSRFEVKPWGCNTWS